MNLDDLKIYLPKYLSEESEKQMFEELKSFPSNIDQRLYTSFLENEPIIFQGDGLNDLLIINLPSTEIKKAPSMVLSNTCDIDSANKRNFPSQIIYSPIIELEKYKSFLNHLPKKKLMII